MAAEIYDVPCSLYPDLMCHMLCIKSRKNAFVECFCKRSGNVRAARGRILVCKVNCIICNVVTEWRDVGHSEQSDLQLTQEPIQTYKQCHVRGFVRVLDYLLPCQGSTARARWVTSMSWRSRIHEKHCCQHPDKCQLTPGFSAGTEEGVEGMEMRQSLHTPTGGLVGASQLLPRGLADFLCSHCQKEAGSLGLYVNISNLKNLS